MTRRTTAALVVAGALGAAAATTIGLLLVRVRTAERRAWSWRPVAGDGGPPAGSAVVVFGGRTRPDGPTGEVRARLDHAHDLRRSGAGEVIVVSGGDDEMVVMSDYLVGRGVPPSVIVHGRPGRNTRETVTTMRRLADRDGLGPLLAVTSGYHARRVEDEARRVGIDTEVAAPRTSPESLIPRVHRVRVATEAVAIAWYALPDSWTRRVPGPVRRLRYVVPRILARPRPEDVIHLQGHGEVGAEQGAGAPSAPATAGPAE